MKTSPLKISIVEHYLKGRGHHAYFLPKFHCEFECAWAQAKVYTVMLTLIVPSQSCDELLILPSTRFLLISLESSLEKPGTMRRPIAKVTGCAGCCEKV